MGGFVRRKIFIVIILFMLFSMPTWQFYLHLDRLTGSSETVPSKWQETYSIGFPFTYISITHTRSMANTHTVSSGRFYPVGSINLLLFILALGAYILIDKSKVKLPPIINSGFLWSRLYILAVFLFGLDTISVSSILFKLGRNSSLLKTWLNIVYDGSALGRALVFPLPTVTRNYFDITSALHMKILFVMGLIFWFILGMVLYKLFSFVKAKGCR
jgi:hypothetical protein